MMELQNTNQFMDILNNTSVQQSQSVHFFSQSYYHGASYYDHPPLFQPYYQSVVSPPQQQPYAPSSPQPNQSIVAFYRTSSFDPSSNPIAKSREKKE